MRQAQFEQRGAGRWQALGELLDELEAPRLWRRRIGARSLLLHRLYRETCRDLALAQERGYGPSLVARLNDLVHRGHGQVYVEERSFLRSTISFLVRDFPMLLRREQAYFWVALAAFAGPWAAIAVAMLVDPDLVYAVMPASQVADVEAMYDPANRVLGEGRSAGGDWAMFGFYVWNNVSIALRAFSTGLLLGIGSLFTLAFNGLYIGAVATHLTQLGFNSTFWPFVIGHGSLELTAIVISGAAGLVLGHALLAPGRRTRVQALVERGVVAVQLVTGAAVMLLGAAVVEAFWSSSTLLPVAVKLAVGGLGWLLVVLWLVRAGAAAPRGAADGP